MSCPPVSLTYSRRCWVTSYVVVVRAVLQAARTLTWSELDKLRLFLLRVRALRHH